MDLQLILLSIDTDGSSWLSRGVPSSSVPSMVYFSFSNQGLQFIFPLSSASNKMETMGKHLSEWADGIEVDAELVCSGREIRRIKTTKHYEDYQ